MIAPLYPLELIMKKSSLKPLRAMIIALGLSCVIGITLLACNSSSKKAASEDRETMRARKTAEEAGIDVEKNPAALLTRRDLKNNTKVTVVGLLRQVGTARFPEVVVTPPANFDIYLNIDRKDIQKYAELFNNFVTVTGLLKIEMIQYGDIERERYSMKIDAPPKLAL
jgi:hypothetical protein